MKMSIAVTGALCAAAVSTAALAAKPTTRNRAEIPAEFRWDFAAIYPELGGVGSGDEGARRTHRCLRSRSRERWRRVRRSCSRPTRPYDEIGKLQYRLYRYTALQRDVDTRDQAVAGRFQRVRAVFARFETASAWFTPELLKIPEATVTSWIDADAGARAVPFPDPRQPIASRRTCSTTRASGCSRWRASSTTRRATTYEELSTSDIKFPTLRLADGKDVVLSPGNYAALLESNRDQAERAHAPRPPTSAPMRATANTYAAIYNGILQRDWFMARARNFDSTLDAALDGNAIPPAVVETLVDATRAGTRAVPALRAAAPEAARPGDAITRTTRSCRSTRARSRTRSRRRATSRWPRWRRSATSTWPKYKQFVSGGRIDVYENEGKRSGAYSAGVYGVGPYMLMNYNDTLDAAFTLAHEAGHSMHTVLSYETQPFVDLATTRSSSPRWRRPPTSGSCSTSCSQQTTDPKERFLLLQHAVDSIVGTFYTQVMFADFELRAHRLVEKGEPVTTEVLNALYAGLLKEYWGDAMTVDDYYKFTWARIGHFFFAPYYVYQYATCFASSAQLYAAMTSGAPESRKAATDRYLTLLRSGGNDYPMAQLKKAGVDLTQRATIQAVIDQMDRLVTQMEARRRRSPNVGATMAGAPCLSMAGCRQAVPRFSSPSTRPGWTRRCTAFIVALAASVAVAAPAEAPADAPPAAADAVLGVWTHAYASFGRAQVSARLRPLRLRQPGRAQGRHAVPAQPRPAHQLRQVQLLHDQGQRAGRADASSCSSRWPCCRRDEPQTMYGLLAEEMLVAPDKSSITFRLASRRRASPTATR